MGMDREEFPRLFVLCDQGISDDCDALAEEISDVLDSNPPENEEVAHTLEDLVATLEGVGMVPCYVGES